MSNLNEIRKRGVTRFVGVTDVGAVRAVYHNRNIASAKTTHPGADTTNHCTFTESEGVTKVSVDAIGETAAGLQNDEKYLVVVNIVNAATAKGFLEAAGTSSTDIVYEMGSLLETLEIWADVDGFITRLDFLPLNVNMRFIVSGE